METNILYYLKYRELGLMKKMQGKIVILSRPNFNEDFYFYDW